MKHIIFSFLLSVLVGFSANASHAGMMELTYRHISGTTYEITLVFYRNCQGSTASAPSAFSIGAKSTSRSVSINNAVTLPQLPTSGPGAPALRPPNMFNCTNVPMCFEEYVYRGSFNLANISTNPYAKDWEFFAQLCCYPGGVIIPDNIVGGTIYASCGLNNLDFPNNDAPFWHDRRPIRPGYTNNPIVNYPGKSVCVDRLITHKQNVVEYEGDRVHYELMSVKDAGGVNATYKGTYTPTSPMQYATPPGFEIDSVTGYMDVIATASTDNVFIIGLKATEYRMDTIVIGGVLTPVEKYIGYVDRNYMVIVEPKNTCPDNSFDLKRNSLTFNCAFDSISVEMNGDFICESADFDGSFIQLTDSTGTTTYTPDSVVVLNCDPTGLADEFTIYLNSKLPAGKYYLAIKNGNDGNTLLAECGYELPALNDSIEIRVDSMLAAKMEGSQDSLGNPKPYLDAKCGQDRLLISMDKEIKCTSIENSGSDFLVVDSNTTIPTVVPINRAYPTKCSGGFTKDITIELNNPINGGRFALFLKSGSDGNTLLNECSNASVAQYLPLVSEAVDANLGADFTYCKGKPFFAELDPGPGFTSYKWNDGSTNRKLPISNEGTFTVEVENEFGCVDRDTIVVTEIDCSTGIGENSQDWFDLYPNPVRDVVFVALKKQLNIEKIRITDTNGRLIEEVSPKGKSKIAIDLSDIENGLYFISLVNINGEVKASRIVISH